MKVGDTVYVVSFRHGRVERKITTVKKIGRKYFYAGDCRFEISTSQYYDESYGTYTAKCYFRLEDYYNYIKDRYIKNAVNSAFRKWDTRNELTPEQYQQIFEVLGLRMPTLEELRIEFKEA